MKKPNLNKPFNILFAILASMQMLFIIFTLFFESGWGVWTVFIPSYIIIGIIILLYVLNFWIIPIDYTEED